MLRWLKSLWQVPYLIGRADLHAEIAARALEQGESRVYDYHAAMQIFYMTRARQVRGNDETCLIFEHPL